MARTRGMGANKVAIRCGKEKANSRLTRLALAAENETNSGCSGDSEEDKREEEDNEEGNNEEEEDDNSNDSDTEVHLEDTKANNEDEEEEDDSGDDEDDGTDEEARDREEEEDNEEEEEDDDEEEGEEDDEGVEYDDELPKLSDPPPLLGREFFTEKYGFQDEGADPMKLTKWKGQPFDDSKCVALFGEPCGAYGRNGYSWKSVKSRRIRKRVQDLMTALYQREVVPHLLPHKMARGIVLEEENEKVNWAAYGAATNLTQRKTHARNMVKLGKAKEGTAAQRGAWRKIPVDPRELHSEVCEGRGSSMGGKFAEGDEGGSRLEYVARLLAVENLELEARMEAERVATGSRETLAKALEHNAGLVTIMKKRLKRYEKDLARTRSKGTMDKMEVSALEVKAEAYADLVQGERKRGKQLEKSLATMDEALSVKRHSVAMKRMQVGAIQAEHAHLGHATGGLHMRPLPLVYSIVEVCNGRSSIDIGNCSLCGYGFPRSEFLSTSCRHLYHPWCATVVFTQGTVCCVPDCLQVQPIQWIMSFGWRGVRGWGRPSGGDDWIKMLTECASATTASLTVRSESARARLTAIEEEGNVVHMCTNQYTCLLICTS